MTAGNNGTPEPENDDPFAYLYRGEGDEVEAAQDGRPGIPRTSYHQVSRVGERRSPQQAQQAPGYGYPSPQQTQQTQGYGQSHGQPAPPQRGGAHGGGGSLADNRRGLMIGAIAVVAVVVVGIAVAVLTDKNGGKGAQAASSPSQSAATSQPSPTSSSDPNAGLPQQFAASLTLSGGAETNTNHKGALGPNGAFVDGMTTPGATATWATQVQRAGEYTLWVRYANANGNKATSTVLVNGKPLNWKINLDDYGQQGNWDQWFTSYVSVNLNKGANTIVLTCGSGDTCNFNVDRIGLTTDSSARPNGWS